MRSRSKAEVKGNMVDVLCFAESRALRPRGTFLRGGRMVCASSPPLAHLRARTHMRMGEAGLSIVGCIAMAMLHRQTRAASLPPPPRLPPAPHAHAITCAHAGSRTDCRAARHGAVGGLMQKMSMPPSCVRPLPPLARLDAEWSGRRVAGASGVTRDAARDATRAEGSVGAHVAEGPRSLGSML